MQARWLVDGGGGVVPKKKNWGCNLIPHADHQDAVVFCNMTSMIDRAAAWACTSSTGRWLCMFRRLPGCVGPTLVANGMTGFRVSKPVTRVPEFLAPLGDTISAGAIFDKILT
jgi:hypothetical protein